MNYSRIAFLVVTSFLTLSCSQKLPDLQVSQAVNIFSKDDGIVINKPDTIEMPSPHSDERADGSVISTIVLHHTASAADAKAVGRFFASPAARVSSHYIVDRTGYVVQPVQDNKRAWHAGKSEFMGVGNVNNISIGIEICNLGNHVEVYPEAQYDAIIRLTAYLVKTYNVPVEHITRHRDVAIPAGRKVDTSDNFSVQKVTEGVKAVLNGTYNSVPQPVPSSQPVTPPEIIEIKAKKGESSLKLIADIYLDNEFREDELKLLNKNIKNPNAITAGTKVKLPTSYRFFYQLHGKAPNSIF